LTLVRAQSTAPSSNRHQTRTSRRDLISSISRSRPHINAIHIPPSFTSPSLASLSSILTQPVSVSLSSTYTQLNFTSLSHHSHDSRLPALSDHQPLHHITPSSTFTIHTSHELKSPNMSQFYMNPAHQAAFNTHAFAGPAHPHHASRSRRSQRYGTTQGSSKPVKTPRIHKESGEHAQSSTFRNAYEAARSFDLEDDEAFCPWHLLTEDDVCTSAHVNAASGLQTNLAQLHYIHSSSSDRSSSSSSGSPESSPMQPQLQPTPAFSLPGSAHNSMAAVFQQGSASHLKVHQPLAQRARAIPIIDPTSRNTSPPTSISPARQVQKSSYLASRRW